MGIIAKQTANDATRNKTKSYMYSIACMRVYNSSSEYIGDIHSNIMHVVNYATEV